MKKILVVVIILTGFFATQCNRDPRNDTCKDDELVEMMKDSICDLTCDGVCACNGVTYCNECEAMKAGFTVAVGDTIPCSQK